MIDRLEGVPSFARPDSWPTVQNNYLQVIETVEQRLGGWFEDDDGTAARLFSPHYAKIQDMTESTVRKEPLISGETGRQVTALKRLQAKVEAARAMQDRPGHPAVLDTNVLMHYHRFDRVSWAEVLGISGPVRLILPICVIDELDNKKYTGSDRMSRRASLAIAALREHSTGLRPGCVATLPDGTTAEVFLDEPGHVRKGNPDEELLSRSLLLKRVVGTVTIVTGDLGMQLRADASGLAHAVMPDRYAKDATRQAAVEGD
jgi:hypothetical protein